MDVYINKKTGQEKEKEKVGIDVLLFCMSKEVFERWKDNKLTKVDKYYIDKYIESLEKQYDSKLNFEYLGEL